MIDRYVEGWDSAVQARFSGFAATVPSDGNKWYTVTHKGSNVVKGFFGQFSAARFEAEKRGYYELGYEIIWYIREGSTFKVGVELCVPAKEKDNE